MRSAVYEALRKIPVVAVAILVALVATAWMRVLALPDEGRYVGVAWEMMRSGDWLTPTLNGSPFFHKPPLFYWITAGAMSVAGLNECAARAAPILGAWLCAFPLYLFLRRWRGASAAQVVVTTLMVQPLFYLGGQFANLDMLVAGCISTTILLLAHAVLQAKEQKAFRAILTAAFATAALGVLAKGLIGMVLPCLIVGGWLIFQRRWKTLCTFLLWWPGWLVFALISAPWFVAMQFQFPDFLNYFFVVQHFKRFAATGFNNVQPVWFYPAVVMVSSLPAWIWLCRLFQKNYWAHTDHGGIRSLMAIWFVAVLLFFSLPQSKLIGYILPAIPPLAFFIADGFISISTPSVRTRRVWWSSLLISGAASLAAVAVFFVSPLHSSRTLSKALGAQIGPQDQVFMLSNYYYDVAFYARLSKPVAVVDDWTSPDIRKRDNWRKEMLDAGQFAGTQSEALLIGPEALPAALCRSQVSWVMGPSSAAAPYPFLTPVSIVLTTPETTLWKIDSTAPEFHRAGICPKQ